MAEIKKQVRELQTSQTTASLKNPELDTMSGPLQHTLQTTKVPYGGSVAYHTTKAEIQPNRHSNAKPNCGTGIIFPSSCYFHPRRNYKQAPRRRRAVHEEQNDWLNVSNEQEVGAE